MIDLLDKSRDKTYLCNLNNDTKIRTYICKSTKEMRQHQPLKALKVFFEQDYYPKTVINDFL